MKKKLLIALSFRSNHYFTPNPKHLCCEVCSSVDPLNAQQRGWSYAASVPSEAPDAPKARKRVPRHERRAMVESFVNKYRAENAGKFPKAWDTQKQVGGSFYVIREIIQELEYKSKVNSSNSIYEILVEKQFDESKLLTTKSVNVSSRNIELAKDRPILDDSQLVVLDDIDKETVNTASEHPEGKRGPQTSYWERRLSEEVEMSTPSNHCVASESNIVEKCSEESYPSRIHMLNDVVKNEEAICSYSDSVAPESRLPQEEREQFSPSFNENYGTGYGKVQGPQYDFVDMEDHKKMEENCIKKAGFERREQPALEGLSKELSHSNLQVPNDEKSEEAVSSSCSVTQERHLLNEEIEQFSGPSIEKSESSCSEGQSHDSKFIDMENHPAIEKKSFGKEGYERKEQETLENLPAADGPKHEIKKSQRSSELDESEIDSSNNRETSVAVDSENSTLWGNLKSFANGIINIWRKF
ncbi:uncharacterized protein LOC113867921 [Abrus precatorius]|uniref:Uncharacterized protein LOC113867921 n=1 Tax=Abrus precatorius TaxID=3816 RepID=A0A8B8LS77_ABRPR|nr:uncharacterized protein LOC113867921 [Abrus precatorius]